MPNNPHYNKKHKELTMNLKKNLWKKSKNTLKSNRK